VITNEARQGLSAPVNLTWEVTLACNLNCRHCLSAAGRPMDRELSTEESLAVLDELARLKVFQINVGGGEPFVRPDFFRILEYALKMGIVACISTNGTLLNRETCRRLADMRGVFLQVSLDGVDEQTNDAIRGKGTHRQVMEAMGELSRQGVEFSLNTVLTRRSFDQLESLKSLARSYGARLRVSRLRPSGRAKDCWSELAPSKEQLESFARWLEGENLVLTGDSFFSLTSEHRRRMGLDMCGAAKMTCCLSPDGNLFPCAFLQEPEFLAGNIRTASLEEMWRQGSVFKTFRELEAQACQWCSRFETCRGGCPAMAYYMYHDLSEPDPECLMQVRKLIEAA